MYFVWDFYTSETVGNFFRKKLFSSSQIVWEKSKETIDFALSSRSLFAVKSIKKWKILIARAITDGVTFAANTVHI